MNIYQLAEVASTHHTTSASDGSPLRNYLYIFFMILGFIFLALLEAQSDADFYKKYSCQRKDKRFLNAIDAGSPYGTLESYVKNVLLNKDNSEFQKDIFITDIFYNLSECHFGDRHSDNPLNLDALFTLLTEKYQSKLSSESLAILLEWITERCPAAHTGHLTSTFPDARFLDLNGKDMPLPPQLEKVLHFSSDNFARLGSLALMSNKRTPGWALVRSFNAFVKAFDDIVVKERASLDAMHLDFLRTYILSPKRKREDILAFAYKPYRWLNQALEESPHFREEDRVISALLFSGE